MVHFVLIIKALLETLIILLILFTIALVGVFITDKIETYYRNWKTKKRVRQLNKEWDEFAKRQREIILRRELRRKEKEKYPLFFLKEGII